MFLKHPHHSCLWWAKEPTHEPLRSRASSGASDVSQMDTTVLQASRPALLFQGCSVRNPKSSPPYSRAEWGQRSEIRKEEQIKTDMAWELVIFTPHCSKRSHNCNPSPCGPPGSQGFKKCCLFFEGGWKENSWGLTCPMEEEVRYSMGRVTSKNKAWETSKQRKEVEKGQPL